MNWVAILYGFVVGPTALILLSPLVWAATKLDSAHVIPSMIAGGLLFMACLAMALIYALGSLKW